MPGQKVRHYYHIYAGGRWPLIVRHHLAALEESGIDWDLVVGIVGTPDQVRQVRAKLPADAKVHTWRAGFEQRTLNVLVDDLKAGLRGPVMYAHTKAAGYPRPSSNRWRVCMTNRVVREAKVCLDHLAEGADTVGAHWIRPEEWPEVTTLGKTPFYGGNFWWATSDHLATLGRPSEDDRFGAERWIGTMPPRNPINLVPGWPGALCETHL